MLTSLLPKKFDVKKIEPQQYVRAKILVSESTSKDNNKERVGKSKFISAFEFSGVKRR
jgi:hypothetical protein